MQFEEIGQQLRAYRLESGMRAEEIAARLGVSLAKVKTDILRARQALAKHLTRAAGDRSALAS